MNKLIEWFWGNQKSDFKPRAIFNAYCYFRADNTMADYIKEDPSEFIVTEGNPLTRLIHRNETTLLMYARYLNLKGNVMSWVFSWWWVVYDDEYYELLKGANNV